MKIFHNRYPLQDAGLLILRAGVGILFAVHGFPKLLGGVSTWTSVGQSMELLGIHFAPAFWGFMAAFAEAVGGQLLALGLFNRLACLLLMATMAMATFTVVAKGGSFQDYAEPLELFFVVLGLFLTGPGRFSVDQALFPAPRRRY